MDRRSVSVTIKVILAKFLKLASSNFSPWLSGGNAAGRHRGDEAWKRFSR